MPNGKMVPFSRLFWEVEIIYDHHYNRYYWEARAKCTAGLNTAFTDEYRTIFESDYKYTTKQGAKNNWIRFAANNGWNNFIIML